MKTHSTWSSATLLFACLHSACGNSDPGRAVASGRNDVVYLAPATEPYEALPLGNGQLGVVVRNQGGLTWLFNHGSFFANAAQDNDLLSSGEVTLALPEDWQRGLVEQRLLLHDAALVTRYQTGRDTHTVTSWMAEGLDLLVVQVESTAPLPELAACRCIPGLRSMRRSAGRWAANGSPKPRMAARRSVGLPMATPASGPVDSSISMP